MTASFSLKYRVNIMFTSLFDTLRTSDPALLCGAKGFLVLVKRDDPVVVVTGQALQPSLSKLSVSLPFSSLLCRIP